MFLSIVGTSELRIQNIKPPVLEEIKRMIGTMWHPGIEAESMGPNHVWHVKLANTPWSSVGTDAIMYGLSVFLGCESCTLTCAKGITNDKSMV